jgi:hypothetical protein
MLAFVHSWIQLQINEIPLLLVEKTIEYTSKHKNITVIFLKFKIISFMYNHIIVEQLDSKKAEEIAEAVSVLSKEKGKVKQLFLMLNNTKGDFKLAIDLAKTIHASNVDVTVEAHGVLDSAGTILTALGKKGERYASLDTIFTPFEDNTKSVREARLTPKNQAVLSTLSSLRANRRRLKIIAPKAENLSAFEAKALDVIDRVDRFQSKYFDVNSVAGKSSKKKSSGKKSSKR